MEDISHMSMVVFSGCLRDHATAVQLVLVSC